jgi:hypothetical protein
VGLIPDFLSSFLAPANFMRFSLMKAALAGAGDAPCRKSGYSGFPVELSGAGEFHAAFLNESRTRGCWWRPVREIRILRAEKDGRSPTIAFTESRSKPHQKVES